ncbi:hypothetical protein [Pontibaca methylaminivorans]|uniref:Uncharacterized protein n=1 Tax=Pontibaca methylaminivorans TaxID=515897 RepID=A0A1R3X7W7_9RHOB|nr:hypothetical protein [Pontibaca methylaminivorans]SIT86986.1 hypothetical protein SAMN05421849_2485 [Pontibaca methylaminivorans]
MSHLVVAVLAGFAACILSVTFGAGMWLALASYTAGLWVGFGISVMLSLLRGPRKIAVARHHKAIV